MKDPKPDPLIESEQKPEAEKSQLPEVGATVRAMGFNGEIEDGWAVKIISKKRNVAVLSKEIPGGNPRRKSGIKPLKPLKKYMSPEQYREWNPELFAQPTPAPEPVEAPQENITAPVEHQANTNELVKEYGVVSRAASKETHGNNEDRVLAQPEDGVFGVFDGMGGHAGGERASELAKEAIEKKLKELPKDMDAAHAVDALRTLIMEANQAILEEKEKDPGLKEMGTTASLVKLISIGKKQFAAVVTVGDSPVYVVRKDGRDGELECMGIDNDMLGVTTPGSPREIKESDARLANVQTIEDYQALQDYEKKAFNQRHILVNPPVGSKGMLPEDHLVVVQPGDRIVIASDGITDNLTRKRIAQIAGNYFANASESSQMLANEARTSADLLKSPEYKKFRQDRQEFPERNIRAKDDDMSAIVVEVGEAKKSAEIVAPAPVLEQHQAERMPAAEKHIVGMAAAPESEPEQKEKLPTLDEAREAYVRAHREYRDAKKGRPASIYDLGGDTSAMAEARATYDAALKAATQAEREKLMKESGDTSRPVYESMLNYRTPEEINRALFDKFIVDEERKMAALKVSELNEQKQSWYKKAWVAYARLPSWKKIAISTTISTGVGLAAGGGVGVLYRRAVSPFVSAGAGFLTNIGFGVYDKTLGKKDTKEYQINELLQKREGDISECLDDMKDRYGEILQNQAGRERKRMYLRIAIAAAAGATVSGIIAHNMPAHITPDHPAGAHPAETAPLPKAPEHPAVAPVEHGVVEVHKGDSLWEITAKELEKNPDFDKLTDAQKTWVISDMVDRIEAHKAAFGIANPDSLVIGEKIDLSSVMKDGDVHGLMERAGHLTTAQQENILANNHAIASWLHAHPHEHLTGARVTEIVHDRLHPHDGIAGPPPEIPDHGNALAGPPPDFEKIFPSHHPDVVLAPQHVRVGAIADQIHKMAPDPERGRELIERINGIDQIPPVEMRQLLLIAAERAGDHHPMLIDMNNAMEVHRQMRDYLVSYPRAQEFGFRSYDHWAGVRDVPVHRFAEDTMISPRPEALRSALQHSFFHRGASVHEMQGGALRSVPLEERHANLGMAIRANSELVRHAPPTTTVGDFVAAHHGAIRRK